MAGITALNKIRRQQAAFGGIMGRDGRRQYGGGSDMGQVADDSGKTGPGTGGYQGGPVGGMVDAGRTGPTDKNPYDKTPEQFKTTRKKEKDKYKEQFDGVDPVGSRPRTFLDTLSQYNKDYQFKANRNLARKRAFQIAKQLEKYVHGDIDMDYDFTQDIYGNKIDKGLEFLTSNKGTSIESKRPNLYSINSALPGRFSILNPVFNKIRPDTQVTLKNAKKAMQDYNMLSVDPNISKEKLDAIANRGKTPDQINPRRDGEGPQLYPYPFDYNTGAALPIEDIAEEKTFDYRFGTGQNVGADVLRGYVANGGRITRAGGGIMNAVPRQGFLLGGIGKAVGKVVGGVADAAGKVLKSDLGKAAMLYAGGVYLGGGNVFSAASYNPMNFLGKKGYLANIAGKALLKDPSKGFGLKDNLSMMKILGLSAALPFIPGINKAPVDQMPGENGATGGRLIDPLTGEEGTPASMRANIENAKIEAGGDPVKLASLNQKYNNMLFSILPYENYGTYAQGGRIKAQEGGLMNLGGMEKDYRAEGGFVPIGKEEKADDVPARLSVNEFVFTADAVRNAGGGDIDKGAEVMENMMKNLENGGRVSEESQGNTGAQEMFSVSERIGEVIEWQ